MLQSLRARLAFLFAGTLVLATVIAAVVVVSLYQSYNHDQTVSQLRKQVARSASSTTRKLFDKSRTGKVRGAAGDHVFDVRDRHGAAKVFYAGPPLFQGAHVRTNPERRRDPGQNFDLQAGVSAR